MAPKKSDKKRKKATPRQMKLIEERAKGKSYSDAAIAAGYPEKNARQSGCQAMQQLRGRVPDLLDRHGLSEDVVDWVAESGKNLTTIYITHAHGDHFLGLKSLLDRFPNAKAFATASTVAAMQNQVKPEFINSFWEPRFPGQAPSQLAVPKVLEGDTLFPEGEELKVIELGHTDTQHTTALHVPSICLVISGDAVYNNTHPYLAECDEKARVDWLRALEKIEALHPKAVVAGHGVLDPDSSPRHIEETRRYLHDFNASAASTSTAVELYAKMLTLHPNRVNPGSLWATAKTVKPS